MEEVFGAIEAFGVIGILVYVLVKQDKDNIKDEASHNAEVKYYRSLAFSLLTVVFIALIEDENKIKSIVDSMSKPQDAARDA